MQRFFLPAQAVHGELVHFAPAQARQMRTVLRLQPGARFEALDDMGLCYQIELQRLDKNEAVGRILTAAPAEGEPAGDLILCQAIARGERFDWVLQKGTELGVTHFQPVITQRTMRRDPGENTQERWQRIVREAAEQCGRGRLPRLEAPISFAAALERRRGLALLPALAAAAPITQALAQAVWPVTLFIGPEGGFAPAEIALARAAGVEPVGLGPRVLRTETAALALLTLTLAALGEFDRPAPHAPTER